MPFPLMVFSTCNGFTGTYPIVRQGRCILVIVLTLCFFFFKDFFKNVDHFKMSLLNLL